MSPDAILAGKSLEQLQAALKRGEEQLAMLDVLEQSDDDWDGPFPPARASEQFAVNLDSAYRRLLAIGLHDVRAELARRAALAHQPVPAQGEA